MPGVAVITSIVRSLPVKAATFGKTASGEPLLPRAFAQTLAEVDRQLGECLGVTYWPGGAARGRRVRGGRHHCGLRRAGVAEDVRHGARGAASSSGPALVPLIGRAALAAGVVDDRGRPPAPWRPRPAGLRLAPRLLRGVAGRRRRLVRQAAAHSHAWRRIAARRISPAEAGAIQAARADAGPALSPADARIHAPRGTGFTVIYDADLPSRRRRSTDDPRRPSRTWPTPPSCHPVARLIQTVGRGRRRTLDGLAERLSRAGASRITSSPDAAADHRHHDGQGRLGLVRWTDIESEACPAAVVHPAVCLRGPP